MGITNIHYPDQLLARAGDFGGFTDQAFIMPFDKAILIVARKFLQEEVNALSQVLQTPHQDKWVMYNGIDPPKPVSNDKGLSIPSLYTSPGLKRERTHEYEKPKRASGDEVEFAFIIVVRGASAALFSKVRIFYSYFAVAAGIMEEALQGFSVVFSGAMLKGDIPKLGREQVAFRRVDGLKALIAEADMERADNKVSIYC